MNPFAIQAEFTRQWLSFTGAMTKAAFGGFAAAGERAASGLSAPAPLPSFSPASMFAPSMFAPWMAFWPKPAMPSLPAPFGAFMNPMSQMPASMAFPQPVWPWSQFLAPAAPMANPMSTPASLPMPFAAFFTLPWMLPMSMMNASLAPFSQALAPRNPGTTMLDQMASNYRSTSGYAVAAVITPLPNPLVAQSVAQSFAAPWLQLFGPRTLN